MPGSRVIPGAWFALSVVVLCLGPRPAAASSFTVSPIQVDLRAGHRTEVITVHNDEDTPVLLQAQVLGWSQPQGVDELAATAELLVTPAVFTLPARGQQVLRIALRRDADRELERDYRLIVEEVPGSLPKDFTGLNMALRISLPVFVLPAMTSAPALAFSSEWEAGSGRLTVAATNTGTAHVQLRGIEARPDGAEGPDAAPWQDPVLRYVLPGVRRTWVWTLPTGATAPPRLRIDADSDQGHLTATVSPLASSDSAVSPHQP
jgi:fimbrial chaperone protein